MEDELEGQVWPVQKKEWFFLLKSSAGTSTWTIREATTATQAANDAVMEVNKRFAGSSWVITSMNRV